MYCNYKAALNALSFDRLVSFVLFVVQMKEKNVGSVVE